MRTLLAILFLSATASAQLDFECPDEFEGYYPHDLSCDRYWKCINGRATLETCGNGLAFADLDPTYATEQCDYIYQVECGLRTELEPPISAPNCPRLYGTFPDEDDCTGFYNCRDGVSNRYSCAPGLAFDPETRVCKWADQVDTCKKTAEENQVFACPTDSIAGTFTKHPHPEDCRQYFVCIAGTAREYGCPLGTVFSIGNDAFDGKCADPEEVPECANYYGDLDFDKNELVRSGADPEAVGVPTNRVERPRTVSRPVPRQRQNAIPAPVQREEEQPVFEEEPVRTRPAPVRPVPSRPAPARPAPQVPQRSRPTPRRPQPTQASPSPTPRPASPTFSAIPATFQPSPAVPSPTPSPRAPVVPSATPSPVSLLPEVPVEAVDGKKQPAKVKAGDDYYYYYYYYDDEYPEGEGAGAAAAAASS